MYHLIMVILEAKTIKYLVPEYRPSDGTSPIAPKRVKSLDQSLMKRKYGTIFVS